MTACVSLGNYYFNGRYAREDVRSAVREVEQHIEPGDCVVVPTVFEVFEHYFTGSNPVRPIFASARVPRESVDSQLATVFAECETLWYLRARPWANDADAYIVEALEARYRRLQLIEYDGVELFHYASGDLQH